MYSRVYVEITNICNMNCSFCHGHSRKPRLMTEDEFFRILDALEGQTKHIYYHLMGEPLLHPQLPLFLEKANKKGFRSVITTNGTLLRERGEEIISAKPHKVSISVHSFEGNDEKAYESYMNDIISFADVASETGIIVVFRLWNKGYDGGRNSRTFDILRSSLEGEWAENTRGIRIRDKLHLEWGDRFEWPDMGAEVQGNSFFCYGLRDHFGILCDGSVVPCCLDSDGRLALGNIFDGDIERILASPRANAIKEGFEHRRASEELCRRCGYAQRFV